MRRSLSIRILVRCEITDAFLGQCLDKPTSPAVEVFMAIPR